MKQDEMIAGMLAQTTRANGTQTLSTAQATLLVQDHISVSALDQDGQSKEDHLQEKDCSCLHHSTFSSNVQKAQQDLTDHLQSVHQQEQSKPTLTAQSVKLDDHFCMDSHS